MALVAQAFDEACAGNGHRNAALDADADRVALAALDTDGNRCGRLHGYGVPGVALLRSRETAFSPLCNRNLTSVP